MDLWDTLARLWRRKRALAVVTAAAALLAVLGWSGTKPAYTMTSQQALRSIQVTPQGRVATTGSFELGMLGTMLVQNLTDHAGTFGDATVVATNAVVSPPAALPLVTVTATGPDEYAVRRALDLARKDNQRFLDALLTEKGRAAEIALVEMPGSGRVEVSHRPRVRSAGAGALAGTLGGLLLLLVWDAADRRRGTRSE